MNLPELNACIDNWSCWTRLIIGEVLLIVAVLAVLHLLIEGRRR